ncbi:MAG: hypothetical protein NZ843_02705 [Fimbriimonadales bacterium]|nr:hypothetical protein [Fimbriimonadales bacterium]
MAFNVRRYLIRVRGGQQYLPVAARLVWFREEHPDWSIETQPLHLDFENGIAVFQATVKDASGRVIANATKMETRGDFADYVEKAECVPLDVRILTADGWKYYDELSVGEPVLAYDLETDQLRWVPLLAVRAYRNAPVVRLWNDKGFEAFCTPDHRWAVTYSAVWKGKRYTYRKLRETTRLNAAHALIVGAPAPSGALPVTPNQAFIMGLLVTDGSIRQDGKVLRGYIAQSKPEVVQRIRASLQGIPHSVIEIPAHLRTFPTGRTYSCRVGYRFNLSAVAMHNLFDSFGIDDVRELIQTVPHLSAQARAAMLEAMMLGDADRRGTFAQNPDRNGWVIDLWTALCALEGRMVCKSVRRDSLGGVWTARMKKTRFVYASNLRVEEAGSMDVWCPQTPLGTWVARFSNDMVAITGNTGAVGRALAMCGYGTQFAPELSEGDVATGRIAYADSPLPLHGEEESERPARVAEGAAEAMICADCGRALRKPQYDLSMAKFQRPLCPDCQRKAQRV